MTLALLLPSTIAETRDDKALESEINSFLRRWHEDTRRVINEPPTRWTQDGVVLPTAKPEELRFSPEAILSGAAIEERDRLRSGFCMTWQGKKKCLGDRNGILAGVDGSDRPEALVDHGAYLVSTLQELESSGLRRSWLPAEPWSGDYWAYFKGVAGWRYADGGFPGADWLSNIQYIAANPADWIYRNSPSWAVNLLSPSEKYDLLVNDPQLELTRGQWEYGRAQYRKNGNVEPWMGICQGWAAAAMMIPRPRSVVRLVAGDGWRTLDFYPSDIQALASLLWATGEFESRFAGGRCRVANPATDANGRIVDPDCFDANPALWHLAVTNQLGVSRRSLTMDATYDYEVWNQPIVGYSYSYFNPQTRTYVRTLEEAWVPFAYFTTDRFAAYRSPEALGVVGIAMDVSYMIGRPPSHATGEPDYYRTVRYYYDLELNASAKVIGGEWYQNAHPDFLWVPIPGARAVSQYEDLATETWTAGPPPTTWQLAAREASKVGTPLARIVEALIALSSGP
ncbi:MAG: hypothetical protein NDJ90_07535 [Oligoflexia bacterium]|nr:hypothetical protein [Oligoflexia bacterium]